MTSPDDDNDRLHMHMAPLMEAIGHVAHHWAQLEFEVNKVIWALAAVHPDDGACITAQIASIVPRLRALISLANRNGASQTILKDLNRFSARADGLARRRNRVIHDPWFFREHADRLEFGRLEITADRKLTYEIKSQSRKEVLDIARDTIAATKAFYALRERLCDELRERLESRLGTPPEEYLDSLGPSSAPSPHQAPRQP